MCGPFRLAATNKFWGFLRVSYIPLYSHVMFHNVLIGLSYFLQFLATTQTFFFPIYLFTFRNLPGDSIACFT